MAISTAGRADARVDAKLAVDTLHMLRDRVRAELEVPSDLAICQALHYQPDYLSLPRRQRTQEPSRRAGDQPVGGDLLPLGGGHHGQVVGRPPDRPRSLEQQVGRHHPVVAGHEHVADVYRHVRSIRGRPGSRA